MSYTKLTLARVGSVIYLPNNMGGFDVSGCPNSEDLAERIVECVVACDGIGTKILEHANKHRAESNGINTAYSIAVGERDTYRELCGELVKALSHHIDQTQPIWESVDIIVKAEKILGENNAT